jgi:hypothetical protein
VGVDYDPFRPFGVTGATHDQDSLVLVAGAREDEQPLSSDRGSADGRELQQRDQSLAPCLAPSQAVEHLSGACVLGRYPLRDFSRLSRFQPAVRVFDLDTVKYVDDVVAAGRRRRGDARLARSRSASGRRWGACRGWPCCGGP